ncbi:hypothetical protein A2715_00370 [Candidatus Woesebacteria bacterium RIFCSPHIGHO2_01_FULL_39_32]|uniref:PIN domain-containing protein n=2 Tax=Candidatus Woeseibacteriota TaxID=1752722 RepID=A0A0G0PZV2_9BACT|nr:MAG: hypothetical protein UT61_C0004G0053 [Candidatus Woesebacteria bacterium GW2011_GWA1_39_8]OGM03597.1 MAG: hypothetical protein A2124_01690 [Candidatus Woesebacteria bacterium GWB1_37_5]OGM24280.1 MAG: hypothetical protein A2715_00370 [Candidatus Woesebacteria bacterium RIFCSPHIGHO2_01_FULL_39_32]OGM35407.1 MAG: hypothetical protein A3F01_04725 [Candidatus Woesebacteria bacterium RIFCSPHIGHO2_12_FULL_38_11]OGM65351.1 MAG: hypothetical protein A2893_01325 [Candidatus Woesebacteria bacteri
MKIIVDTSILIDNLRGGDKWNKFQEKVDEDSEIFLPTIVVFELFLGSSSQRKDVEKKIGELRKCFQQIELTWDIAKRSAEIYRSQTKDIEAADCIIAASSFEIGGSVLTLNKKHFEKIPGISIYPL